MNPESKFQRIHCEDQPRIGICRKVLNPIKFHVIGGTHFLDNIERHIDEMEQGVFSTFNILSKITSAGIDYENGLLGLTITPITSVETPWKLLQSCLLTLGDEKAKLLAFDLEKFYNTIETYGEILKGSDSQLTAFLLRELDITRVASKCELAEKILKFVDQYSDEGVFAFVRRGKTLSISEMINIEVIFNRKLCDYIGIDLKDLALRCLRFGFPEFISSDSYYEYWSSVLRDVNGEYTPFELKFTTISGGAKYVRTRNWKRKIFILEEEFYLVNLQDFNLISLQTPKNISQKNESLPTKIRTSNEKNDSYIESLIPFIEKFYPDQKK